MVTPQTIEVTSARPFQKSRVWFPGNNNEQVSNETSYLELMTIYICDEIRRAPSLAGSWPHHAMDSVMDSCQREGSSLLIVGTKSAAFRICFIITVPYAILLCHEAMSCRRPGTFYQPRLLRKKCIGKIYSLWIGLSPWEVMDTFIEYVEVVHFGETAKYSLLKLMELFFF